MAVRANQPIPKVQLFVGSEKQGIHMARFEYDLDAAVPRIVVNGGPRLIRSASTRFRESNKVTAILFTDREWAAIREAVHLEDYNLDRGLADCAHGVKGGVIPESAYTADIANKKRCNDCGVTLW